MICNYKKVDDLVRQAKLELMKDESANAELIILMAMIQFKHIPEAEDKAWRRGQWD